MDFATLIQCAAGKRMAKRYVAGGRMLDYDAGVDFLCDDVTVNNLYDVYGLLCELSREPSVCIIRGAIKPEVDRSELVWRRSRDDGQVPPAFESAPHHWAALDVDETISPFDLADPKGSVERWLEDLHGREWITNDDRPFVWQWSASAHRSPNVRGRLWVWTDQPMTDLEWRPLAKAWGFDPSTFKAVQPIYTAAPLFDEGSDPISERVLWLP